MIIVMQSGASREELEAVKDRVAELGYEPHVIFGVERTVVAAVGHEDKSPLEAVETMAGVEKVMPILKPYKLVSKEVHPEPSKFDVAGVEVGGKGIVVMAGPCSVETREQILEVAREVKDAGGHFLRGGAYKPRTSPYSFQGLGEAGLEYLAEAREETGLKIVTEIVTVTDIDLLVKYADVLQIGARNCQNYALLQTVGDAGLPVLLKRGMSTQISEFLQAAEYILSRGNYKVMLCERGIRTFETSTRFTLDLNAVPVIKSLSHLPVIVDPSHGTGYWHLVTPMARAAVACGADGLMVEVHPQPEKAYSDGAQSLKPKKFRKLMEEIAPVAEAVGREVLRAPQPAKV